MLIEAELRSRDARHPGFSALVFSLRDCSTLTWRWSPDDLLLRYSYVAAAATFLTIAVAIQLELHWVTIAWAVEALMLTWVGLRSGEKAARHAGLAVFCVAVGHWFIRDMLGIDYSLDPSFIPLLNRRALSCAVLVGAIAGAARLYRRAEEIDEDERSTVLTSFALTGNALALTLLSLDINDYFLMRESNSGDKLTRAIRKHETVLDLGAVDALCSDDVGHGTAAALYIVALGRIVVAAGDDRQSSGFRLRFYAASWHLPIFNQTFMAYALLVAALAFGAWLYRRAPVADEVEQTCDGSASSSARPTCSRSRPSALKSLATTTARWPASRSPTLKSSDSFRKERSPRSRLYGPSTLLTRSWSVSGVATEFGAWVDCCSW